jgi:hypothetical protein
MRSPQVNNIIGSSRATTFDMSQATRGGYSDLRVLESNAGFYLGTVYEEFDIEGNLVCCMPGSRDSGYYPTREAAEADLAALEADSNAVSLRLTP